MNHGTENILRQFVKSCLRENLNNDPSLVDKFVEDVSDSLNDLHSAIISSPHVMRMILKWKRNDLESIRLEKETESLKLEIGEVAIQVLKQAIDSNMLESKDQFAKYAVAAIRLYIETHKKYKSDFLEQEKRLFIGSPNVIKSHEERRNKTLDDAAEESPDAPLGRIAFGTYRLDKPYEADTDSESELISALRRHISHDSIPLPKEQALFIKKLIDDGLYDEVIQKPTDADVVYRGFSFTDSRLRKFLNLRDDEEIPKSGSAQLNMIIKPRQDRGWVTSWTKNVRVAQQFANMYFTTRTDSDRIRWAAVVSASVQDNDFFDLEGLYNRVSIFSHASVEKEVIGIGEIKINKIEWTQHINAGL